MTNINQNQNQGESQSKLIKDYLLKGRKITPLEALRHFQCFRLGARIYDLKKAPHSLPIESRMIITHTGKRVAEYYLNPSFFQKKKK